MDALNVGTKDATPVALAEKQDAPPADNVSKTPQPGGEPNKTYTQADIDAERKRQSGLNKTIDSLTKERDSLKTRLGDLESKVGQGAIKQLEDNEKAELEQAGDDTDKVKQVKAKYADLRRSHDIQTENDGLKKQIQGYGKANELLEALGVEDINELVSLINEAQKFGQEKNVKKLSEKYSVSEELIKPLLKVADTPETLEELVKELSDKFPAKQNLPPPGKPGGVGSSMPDKAKEKIKAGWMEIHK